MNTSKATLTRPVCHSHCGWDHTTVVSALVLNWNGERFLRPCLKSLAEDSCPHMEIVLVDNGTKDVE